MILKDSYIDFWRHYGDFTGRTTRSGLWYAFLANWIVLFLLVLLGSMAADAKAVGLVVFFVGIFWIYAIVMAVPAIAIGVRRLRDAGYPWGLYLLSLLVGMGTIALIVLWCMPTVAIAGQAQNIPLAPGTPKLDKREPAATTSAPQTFTTPAPSVKRPRLSPKLAKNAYYGAKGIDVLPAFIKNTANFAGRSTRSEYWWLMLILIPYYLFALAISLAVPVILPLWLLLPQIPFVALLARRYSDAGVPRLIGIIQGGVAIGYLVVELILALLPHGLSMQTAFVNFMAPINMLSGLVILVVSLLPTKPIVPLLGGQRK